MKQIFRFLLAAGLLFPTVLSAGVHFPYRFAPSEGFTNRLEKPYRDEICLNGLWNFQPGETCTGAWDNVRIRIPSPWNVNGFAWNGLEGPDHRDFPSYPASAGGSFRPGRCGGTASTASGRTCTCSAVRRSGCGLFRLVMVGTEGRRNHLLLAAGEEKGQHGREENPLFHGSKDNPPTLIFA